METVSRRQEGAPRWGAGAEWSPTVGPAHGAALPSRAPGPGHSARGLPFQTAIPETGVPAHPRARDRPGTRSHRGSGGERPGKWEEVAEGGP